MHIKLGHRQTVSGKCIYIRRFDLAAHEAKIGVSQIIEHHNDNVRPPLIARRRIGCDSKQRDKQHNTQPRGLSATGAH